VKFAELIAESGLGGEILVGVGIEGMGKAVARGAAAVRAALERAGARSVDEERPEEFFRRRRDASERHAGPGLVTVTVPPSASASLMREFRRSIPNIPVLAHPLLGRIHADAGDPGAAAVIRGLTLAVGGKIPIVWEQAIREGFGGMFTPEELTVARALKRELDPAGVLNPHLKLG
jgi:FAD/FMN-containing dehydrogenase